MKIVAMSDLHGRLPAVPECDVLLIAGDICPNFCYDTGRDRLRQMEWLRDKYATWEETVPAKSIFVTPGNHDWFAGMSAVNRSKMFIDEGVDVLQDGRLFRFWFSPWIPPIGHWNYCQPRDRRKEFFAQIPENLDVLVTHGPAHRVLDYSWSNEPCGCPELRQAIYQKKPKFHMFGHIHEGQRHTRHTKLGETHMFNVAMFGDDWQPVTIEIQ